MEVESILSAVHIIGIFSVLVAWLYASVCKNKKRGAEVLMVAAGLFILSTILLHALTGLGE